ncbi:MAG: hypothetical protein ABSG70_19430 [Terriglobales bacterium]|jgi:hypothetical protein
MTLISGINDTSRGKAMMGAESIDRKPIQNTSQAALALERHYSVAEVAKLWALSEKTIRHMFEDEDGVINWGAPETRRKRRYRTLRIPESVLHRVHRKLRAA